MDQTAGTTPHETQERRPSFYTPGPLLWIAFLVLVVYPLSVGPVALIVTKHPNVERAIGPAYAPLALLYRKCKPVQNFYDWYLEKVWRVR